MNTQSDLFAKDIAERFAVWKATPGGRQLLRFAYAEAAVFARRHARTGQRVSMDYLIHKLRDRISRIRAWLVKRGTDLPREGGYRINDHFTAHIARHILAHRPEWDGLFELREIGKQRKKRTVLVIEERVPLAGRGY
jgi:hypothetical protein